MYSGTRILCVVSLDEFITDLVVELLEVVLLFEEGVGGVLLSTVIAFRNATMIQTKQKGNISSNICMVYMVMMLGLKRENVCVRGSMQYVRR